MRASSLSNVGVTPRSCSPGAMSQSGDHTRLPPLGGTLATTSPQKECPKKGKVPVEFHFITPSAGPGTPAVSAEPVPGTLNAALGLGRVFPARLPLFLLLIFLISGNNVGLLVLAGLLRTVPSTLSLKLHFLHHSPDHLVIHLLSFIQRYL